MAACLILIQGEISVEEVPILREPRSHEAGKSGPLIDGALLNLTVLYQILTGPGTEGHNPQGISRRHTRICSSHARVAEV